MFLVLKLTDVIDWSWWWVTAPLWVPWAIVGALLLLGGLLALLVRAIGGMSTRKRRAATRRARSTLDTFERGRRR